MDFSQSDHFIRVVLQTGLCLFQQTYFVRIFHEPGFIQIFIQKVAELCPSKENYLIWISKRVNILIFYKEKARVFFLRSPRTISIKIVKKKSGHENVFVVTLGIRTSKFRTTSTLLFRPSTHSSIFISCERCSFVKWHMNASSRRIKHLRHKGAIHKLRWQAPG